MDHFLASPSSQVIKSYEHVSGPSTPNTHLTSGHTLEAIPLIARFALAREGSWRVVADGIGVTSVELAFIHVCKTAAGREIASRICG